MIDKQYVRKYYTLAGLGIVCCWVLFVSLGVILFSLGIGKLTDRSTADFSNQVLGVMFGVALPVVVVWYLWTLFSARGQMAHRANTISLLTRQYGWGQNPATAEKSKYRDSFVNSALARLYGPVNYIASNAIFTSDWAYCDLAAFTRLYFSNLFYTGGFKLTERYYGLMVAKLPCKLPHMVFDSRQGRQFRFKYARAQMISLGEPSFDEAFVAYALKDSQEDIRSLISPPVMQAMVAAHEYGFEVLDDTLYMFSPLYQADLQIPDMEKKIMPVRKVLQDAAMAYQAKHQALTDSDEVGSQLDRHLKRSQLNNALVAVGMLVLAGWYLYYEITN